MSKLYQKVNGSAVPLSGGVGVINNLNSTSTKDALSANMGKELNDKISSLQENRLVVHQYTIPVTSKSITANSVTDFRFDAPTPTANYRHVALLSVVATTQEAGGQGHLNWPTIIYPHQISGEVVVYIASLVSHSVNQILAFYLDERLN